MSVDFREVYEKHKQCLNLNCKRMLRLIDNIVDITESYYFFICTSPFMLTLLRSVTYC